MWNKWMNFSNDTNKQRLCKRMVITSLPFQLIIIICGLCNHSTNKTDKNMKKNPIEIMVAFFCIRHDVWRGDNFKQKIYLYAFCTECSLKRKVGTFWTIDFCAQNLACSFHSLLEKHFHQAKKSECLFLQMNEFRGPWNFRHASHSKWFDEWCLGPKFDDFYKFDA